MIKNLDTYENKATQIFPMKHFLIFIYAQRWDTTSI